MHCSEKAEKEPLRLLQSLYSGLKPAAFEPSFFNAATVSSSARSWSVLLRLLGSEFWPSSSSFRLADIWTKGSSPSSVMMASPSISLRCAVPSVELGFKEVKRSCWDGSADMGAETGGVRAVTCGGCMFDVSCCPSEHERGGDDGGCGCVKVNLKLGTSWCGL